MKKLMVLTLALATAFLFGCGSGSEKGKWSQSDKDKFYESMEGVDFSSFGDKKTEWIECYLHKLEANYESFREADQDETGCEKYALECNDEVLTVISKVGAWSEDDKQAFEEAMASVDLSAFGADKKAWTDCYLSKLEANYPSFAEADQDGPGCDKYAEECSKEVLK